MRPDNEGGGPEQIPDDDPNYSNTIVSSVNPVICVLAKKQFFPLSKLTVNHERLSDTTRSDPGVRVTSWGCLSPPSLSDTFSSPSDPGVSGPPDHQGVHNVGQGVGGGVGGVGRERIKPIQVINSSGSSGLRRPASRHTEPRQPGDDTFLAHLKVSKDSLTTTLVGCQSGAREGDQTHQSRVDPQIVDGDMFV